MKANYEELIKIPFLYQLLEDRTYDEMKEIYLNKIGINNFKLILDFVNIEDEQIRNYIHDIYTVSSFNTLNMPEKLKLYLEQFDIKNDKEQDRTIIENLINLKEDCNYLQYDLLGDVIEYKWADNYRIMDRRILKEILEENIEEIINTNQINEIIDLKNLEEKYLRIILYYYKVDEDEIDNIMKLEKITDELLEKKINMKEISKIKFKEILLNNVNDIIEELDYLT
jgi:hypothetical protein